MKKCLTVLLVLMTASLAWAQTASLKDPKSLTEKAPATFNVKFDTSAGAFTVQVNRDWAPLGADRFYNLVKLGFYDNARFFRVVPNFMVQFGINGDPAIQRYWSEARMPDDPVKPCRRQTDRGALAREVGGVHHVASRNSTARHQTLLHHTLVACLIQCV